MDRKNEGWQETLFLSTTSRAHIIYREHTTTVVQKLIFVKPCKAFLKLANIYYFYFYLTNFVDRRLIDRNPSYMVKHKISGPMLLHMDCDLMDYARDVLSLTISS